MLTSRGWVWNCLLPVANTALWQTVLLLKNMTCLVKHPKHTPLSTLLHYIGRQVLAPTDDTR